MNISVVIPTCNRKARLLALLKNLDDSLYPVHEVIVIDTGDDRLLPAEIHAFTRIRIRCSDAEKSVCIQRNTGIRMAVSPWIFICDDDIEMPADYLQKLVDYIRENPEAGAVSGLVLQKENAKWTAEYPEYSAKALAWKYFFQLGIWGSIECRNNNFFIRKIIGYYRKKGNHLSKAGWPVLTGFSGSSFTTPVYGLGASLIKKEWLLSSPFDEVLDRHGIGDHYGVAAGFPLPGIQVLTTAHVYHHLEATNRLSKPLQYYRRVLALEYFLSVKPELKNIKRRWLLWSLTGNFIYALFSGSTLMIKAALKSLYIICIGKNPYKEAAKRGIKVIDPLL